MLKQNLRIQNDLTAGYGGEFVIRFGNALCTVDVPAEKRLDIPTPTNDDVELAAAVSPTVMVDGLLFLADPEDPALEAGAVLKVQREFIRMYFKHVVFPLFSPLTKDNHGVRKQNVPEIVRLISKQENTAYHLRYPLAQKLQQQRVAMPVLLILPGPSIETLGPLLKELSRHCIIVAIARTLHFCLENGVEPDFLIQLDTFLVQRHFFENITRLKRTTLVSLSLASIRSYAHKFRGVLFMDSFNPGILPNPWRLRENPVSTLMACMGLAECLHAPKAILAGTDLCYSTPGAIYINKTSSTDQRPTPPFLVNEKDQLLLPNRQGNGVYTMMRYVATATEAEHFARQILKETGTSFYTLNDNGILNPDLFPCLTVRDIRELPLLDRAVLEKKIDSALAEREDVNLIRLKVDCIKTIEMLNQLVTHLQTCQVRDDMRDEAKQNIIRQFVDKERDYVLPADETLRLHVAVRLARQWRRECVQAKNIAMAHMLASRQAAIPLLCLPQEADNLPGELARLFPSFSWQIKPIASIATPEEWRRPGEIFPSHKLHKFLHETRVAFVTPTARESFSYHFEVLGTDNVVYLDHTLMG